MDSKETLIAPGLDRLLREKGTAILQDEKLMNEHFGSFMQPSSRDLVFGVLDFEANFGGNWEFAFS